MSSRKFGARIMETEMDKIAFSSRWQETCNSHDLDRIANLYSEDVVFKSPRVLSVSNEASGTLRGREAVREYWKRILERRPDLAFDIGAVYGGVDSIALEYRVGVIHGIEFMTLNAEGLISFAVGNDALPAA
jgi:ketosteroid isomerase-like protein